MAIFSDHDRRCECIDCRAHRDFFGPAVITPPSILDVGEHKREAWQLHPTREAGADVSAKPRKPRPVKAPVVIKDAHPFGYKKRRKGRAWSGRTDLGSVTGKPRKPDDAYVKDPNSWLYDNHNGFTR